MVTQRSKIEKGQFKFSSKTKFLSKSQLNILTYSLLYHPISRIKSFTFIISVNTTTPILKLTPLTYKLMKGFRTQRGAVKIEIVDCSGFLSDSENVQKLIRFTFINTQLYRIDLPSSKDEIWISTASNMCDLCSSSRIVITESGISRSYTLSSRISIILTVIIWYYLTISHSLLYIIKILQTSQRQYTISILSIISIIIIRKIET